MINTHQIKAFHRMCDQYCNILEDTIEQMCLQQAVPLTIDRAVSYFAVRSLFVIDTGLAACGMLIDIACLGLSHATSYSGVVDMHFNDYLNSVVNRVKKIFRNVIILIGFSSEVHKKENYLMIEPARGYSESIDLYETESSFSESLSFESS